MSRPPDTQVLRSQPSPAEQKLSVIIVSYNCKSLLEGCMLSIPAGAGSLDYEIIVVDNASSDGTCLWLEEVHPDVRVISNSTNEGFARACNKGILAAHGDWLLLLNPDTTVAAGTMQKTHDYMLCSPWTAACGCRVVRPDGALDPSCKRNFPSPWDALCRMTGLSRMFPKSRVFARYDAQYLDEHRRQSVPLIDGCYMMIRRGAVSDIGLLDGRFFMYGEEMDWCRRALDRGWSIGYDPTGSIVHIKGETTRSSPFRMLYHFHRSMVLYCAKHYGPFHPALPLLCSGIAARYLALVGVNLFRRDRRISG